MTAKTPMTIEDLAEIVQKRFDGVDGRLDGVESRLTKIEVKVEHLDRDIVKLYRSVMKLEYEVRDNTEETAKLKDMVNRLVNSTVQAIKNDEIDDHERVALRAHVDRLDRWVHKIAAKEGIKLES